MVQITGVLVNEGLTKADPTNGGVLTVDHDVLRQPRRGAVVFLGHRSDWVADYTYIFYLPKWWKGMVEENEPWASLKKWATSARISQNIRTQ